jgi:PKD repeat protein
MKKIFPLLYGLSLICTSLSAQGSDPGYIIPAPVCQASFYYYYDDSIMTFAEAYPYRFIDQSYGNMVAWHWDFGDGQTSQEKNPMHFYARAKDTMNVCLTTISADSCISTFCMPLIVGERNNPYDCHTDFTVAVGKSLPPVYVFIPDSSKGDLSCFWDFGDGSFSYEAIPSHKYEFGGYYTVCLQATDKTGCTSYVCQTLLVQGTTNECKASWAAYPDIMVNYAGERIGDTLVTNGRWVYFQDMSRGAIKSWRWDFGDGTGSVEQYPVHAYASEGKYLVCLTIGTVDSCSSTYCDTLVIKPENYCSLTGVVIDKTGLDGCGLLIQLDNGEVLEPVIMPDFKLRPGQRVKLAYTELTNVASICMAGKIVRIDCIEEIDPWPGLCDYFIRLNTDVILNGQTCNGKATVSLVDVNGNDVNATSYLWSTGETGNTISALCPGITYSVIVSDISGCAVSGSFSFGGGSVVVDSLFGYWRYAQDDMTFDFNVPVYSDSVVCVWDFGDGNSATGDNVNHTYDASENYTVLLNVYDKQGNLLLSQEIPVSPGAPTAIRDLEEAPHVYPVPASDILYIKPALAVHPSRIEIMGASGELLISKETDAGEPGTYQLDVSSLPSGFYMGRLIYVNGKPQAFRFVK